MSTRVRLGTLGERTLSMMGSEETALLPSPRVRFVSAQSPRAQPRSRRTPRRGDAGSARCRRRRDCLRSAAEGRGGDAHIPAPRGESRDRRWTRARSLLPLLWPPTTTIWGRVSHTEGGSAVRGVDVVAGQGARFLRRGSFSRERLDIFHAFPPRAHARHRLRAVAPAACSPTEQGLERADALASSTAKKSADMLSARRRCAVVDSENAQTTSRLAHTCL